MNRLDTLWQLQQVDLGLAEANLRLQEAKSQLGESQELFQARWDTLEAEKSLAEWRTRLHMWELELKGLDEKIAEVDERLYSGRVTNPKELSGLQRDLAYLKRRQSSLEDDILQAMAEIEQREAHLHACRSALERIEVAWTKEQERLDERIRELTARARALSASRAALCKAISAEDLELYEDLRRRGAGRAMTELQGDLCQGCRVAVPSAKMQQLRRKEGIIFCGGCGRILYVA